MRQPGMHYHPLQQRFAGNQTIMSKATGSMRLLAAVSLQLWAAGAMAAHWGYGMDNGPDKWADMDPGFAACRTEEFQSPINILAGTAQPSHQRLGFNYSGRTAEIVNNGHTIQVSVAEGNSVMATGSKEMHLRQFHFHTPSENQLDGHAFPMEVHFVHDDGEGHAMVVGVFFREGTANPALERIAGSLPVAVNQPLPLTDVSPSALLPVHREYYAFTGSLTTPPCTGSVSWAVLRDPLTASRAQLDTMRAALHHNARPVQPLNGRATSYHGGD